MIKKISAIIGSVIVLSASLFIAAPVNAEKASSNNFYFESFNAQYELDKDDNDRSVMNVTEELVAVFPLYDQNHGIERAIPYKNDGHVVLRGDIKVWRNDIEEEISDTSDSDGMKIYRIGNSDDYVTGEQKYTIKYTLNDVTTNFNEHQELFWNVNGDQWFQSFRTVSASLVISDKLKDSFSGEVTCYYGNKGSTTKCNSLVRENEISFTASDLIRNQTLSIAAKFKPGTFAKYEIGKEEKGAITANLIIAAASSIMIIASIIFIMVRGRSNKTNRAIIPQYLPPKDINIINAATLYSKGTIKAVSTLILSLAVNGNILVREEEKKKLVGKKKVYTLELVNRDNVDSLQLGILRALFPGESKTYALKDNDIVTGAKLQSSITTSQTKFARGDYYRTEPKLRKFGVISLIAALVGVVLMVIFSYDMYDFWYIRLVTGLLVATQFTMSLACLIVHPKSQKGAEMKDYLKGLMLYMKMAEADRLKYLQSVDGAERIHTSDDKQIVKLYEKLLPYASIFGLEKSWAKVLEVRYVDGSSPDWYIGNGAFNAAIFSSSLNSFSTSLNSYSSSNGSGGSGFSGGSAGGGGGGGGGGGW